MSPWAGAAHAAPDRLLRSARHVSALISMTTTCGHTVAPAPSARDHDHWGLLLQCGSTQRAANCSSCGHCHHLAPMLLASIHAARAFLVRPLTENDRRYTAAFESGDAHSHICSKHTQWAPTYLCFVAGSPTSNLETAPTCHWLTGTLAATNNGLDAINLRAGKQSQLLLLLLLPMRRLRISYSSLRSSCRRDDSVLSARPPSS